MVTNIYEPFLELIIGPSKTFCHSIGRCSVLIAILGCWSNLSLKCQVERPQTLSNGFLWRGKLQIIEQDEIIPNGAKWGVSNVLGRKRNNNWHAVTHPFHSKRLALTPMTSSKQDHSKTEGSGRTSAISSFWTGERRENWKKGGKKCKDFRMVTAVARVPQRVVRGMRVALWRSH